MKRILVVDDKKDIRKLLEETLKRTDYEILQAGTAEDALVISRKMRPDVILMDIMMPGDLNGIEATRILNDTVSRRGITWTDGFCLSKD